MLHLGLILFVGYANIEKWFGPSIAFYIYIYTHKNAHEPLVKLYIYSPPVKRNYSCVIFFLNRDKEFFLENISGKVVLSFRYWVDLERGVYFFFFFNSLVF